jgi:predicted ATPase with chaperone activity
MPRPNRFALLAVAALALLFTPAHAQDDSAPVICKVITDRAAELARTGEMTNARAMKPQIQQCIRLQRAEQDRAARELVKRYGEAR